MATKPSKKLDTFPNPAPGRDFHIHMQIPEFTCLCPMTGQPDFATLILDYVPDKKCVELKAMKLYICLLYTSPSPRDRTRSRMPSSA